MILMTPLKRRVKDVGTLVSILAVSLGNGLVARAAEVESSATRPGGLGILLAQGPQPGGVSPGSPAAASDPWKETTIDAAQVEKRKPAADEVFGLNFHEYMNLVYVRWLQDEEAILRQMRWYDLGKRPVMGVRWGISLHMVHAPEQHDMFASFALDWPTGTAGKMLISSLEERFKDRKFGQFPRAFHSTVRRIPMFSIATEDGVFSEAAWQGLDAVVAIEVGQERVGFHANARATMKMQLIDVVGRKKVWMSNSINSRRAAMTRGLPNDVSVEMIKDVVRQIDAKFSLSPMPELSAEVVKNHLEKMAFDGLAPGVALRFLTEIRYYHLRKLLTDDEATDYCAKVLGSKRDAVMLISGESDVRGRMLEEWLKEQRK